jgi:hypothetical protein
MKQTRLPVKPRCPRCGTLLDGATNAFNDSDPKDDGTSLTVCFVCGVALRITKGFNLELIDIGTLTPTVINKILKVQEAVRKARGRRSP